MTVLDKRPECKNYRVITLLVWIGKNKGILLLSLLITSRVVSELRGKVFIIIG